MTGLMSRITASRQKKIAALEAKANAQAAEAEEEEDEEMAEDDEEETSASKATSKSKASEKAAEDDEEEEGAEEAAASPGQVAQACAGVNAPYLVEGLLKEGITVKGLEAKVAEIKQIRHFVGLARKADPTIGKGMADRFIKNGATLAEVGDALIEAQADKQSPDISNTHAPDAGRGGSPKQDYGWGDIIAKQPGQQQ